MLYRKIQSTITQHITGGDNRILVIQGARQVGKTYIIRQTCKTLFKNYIEINLVDDKRSDKLFEKAVNVQDFFFQLSLVAGNKMGTKENTIVFLDEIQEYPHLLTLLKFLQDDGRFTFIASGSLLGVTLMQTTSIPIGSIRILQMYPLDFEEFLLANGIGNDAIKILGEKFKTHQSLDENTHNKIMSLFRKYLLVGGLPDAVNAFVGTQNIVKVRSIQNEIKNFYSLDASKYDFSNKLKIKRIYEMIPSVLENKKKRIVVKDIEDKKGKRYSNYQEAFDYLINSGVALEVKAISQPKFPLIESSGKNLLKLYLNDVGILTEILYKNNETAILNDLPSVNLGSVYECVAAMELRAHNHELFYYDNKKKGEVDYLIDDYNTLSVMPIEIKSGKDYTIHSALNSFIKDNEYKINSGLVFSNEREISIRNNIVYSPIYNIMFI